MVFHQLLDKSGIEHDYYIGGDGAHDWGTWRAHLHYMPKLWRQGAGPSGTSELSPSPTPLSPR